ncbi:MAG: gliding motility-associated-like protein [Flavobacteriales bacterium]
MSVTNAANCVACDGQAAYSCLLSSASDVEWSSLDGYFFSEPNVANSSIVGLCAGVYLITENFNGENVSSYFLVESEITDLPEVADLDLCLGGDPENLIDYLPAAGVGAWQDPLLQLHSGVFDPDADIGGLYTYLVDENGCQVSTGVAVNLYTPANPGLGTTYLICETYNPFFLTDLMSGSPDYGGTWYNEFFQVVDGDYDPATMDSQLFTYIIDTVPGCPAEFSTMYVIENQLLYPGDDGQIQVCPNAFPFNMTATLTGNPDQSGSWYDDSFDPVSQVFVPFNMLPGDYTYLVPGDSPCPSLQANLEVSLTTGISAGTDAAITLCATGDAVDLFTQLGGSPTLGGVWTNSDGDVIDPSVEPSSTQNGEYTYTVAAVGCQPDAAVIDIFVEDQLVAGPNQNFALCEPQAAVNLNGLLNATSDLGGIWTDINNEIIDPNVFLVPGATHYYYYNQNSALCPNSIAQYGITADVQPPNGPDLNLEFCETDEVVDLATYLLDSEGFNTIFFDQDGNVSTSLFDPLAIINTSFSYLILSDNTCPDSQMELDVIVETLSFENFNAGLELCSSDAPVVLVDTFPELTGIFGTWYDEDNLPALGIVDPAVDSSATVLFVVDNGNVCPPSLATIAFDILALPDVGPDQVLSMCINANQVDLESTLIGTNVDGGQWSFDGAGNDGNFDPSTNLPGIYTYEIPAFGPCLGTSVDVNVIVDMGVAVQAGNDTAFCASEIPLQLGAIANIGYSYQWTPDTYLSNDGVSNPIFTYNDDLFLNASIEFFVTASNGVCDVQDTVVVDVFALPMVDLGPDLIECEASEITLSASGNGIQFAWTPSLWFNNPNAPNQTFDLIQSGMVEVEVTNNDGCASIDAMNILALEVPNVEFDANPIEGCSPLTVQLFNTSSNDLLTTYVWMFDDGTSSIEIDPFFVFLDEGLHDVSLTATSANGCLQSVTYTDYIEVHTSPLAFFETNIDEQTVVNPIVYFNNLSIGATGYLWTFGEWGSSLETNPIIEFPPTPDVIHDVCLQVANQFGCVDSICRQVFIPGEFWIFAPNAFTPDGDGINDVFLPLLRGFDPENYALSIYNRWGEQIFITTDPAMPWLGQNKQGNHFVQNEVFIWQVVVNDAYSAETMKFTGHVSIIR